MENTFGCSPLATALVILGYGLLAAFGAVMSPHFFTGTIMACAKTTCQFFTLMGLISFMLGVVAPGVRDLGRGEIWGACVVGKLLWKNYTD